MTGLPIVLTAASSALLIVLAGAAALRGGRGAKRTLLALTSLTGSAAMLFLAMTIAAVSPGSALARFQVFLALVIVSPAFAVPFFSLFGSDLGPGHLRARLPGIILLAILLTSAALLVPVELVVARIHFTETGAFWGIDFSAAGKGLAIFLLIVNVFVLYASENTFRAANVPAKVTLKYPMLGIVAASIVNFIVMSRILSLSTLDRNFMAAGACGMIFFALSFIYAVVRYPLFDVRTRPGGFRGGSVVSVVVAGMYFLAIALISWVSAFYGMSYDLFSLVVLGAFVLFLLVAAGISGKVRRRARRFINENFRPGRYNYRREWRRYARLMSGSSEIDEFLSNTISSLCETIMVGKGIAWADFGGDRVASYGLKSHESVPRAAHALLELCRGEPVRILGRDDLRSAPFGGGTDVSWARAVAFLLIDGSPAGLIALGEKDMNAPWNSEDAEFLATIADQGSVTLENLQMERKFLESRQMESFNRFASFVIHDLKNTVGMLSLTAENARDNIKDERFQADAIETIERSVQKMRRLIDSLNAHKSPRSITRRPADVSKVVSRRIEEIGALASHRNVTIEQAGEESVAVSIDPAAVGRIVENLLLNAVEALPGGGRIEVEVSGGDSGVYIEVRDDGPGFDEAYLEHSLFKPFASTKKNGLGVGLVLCRTLAEAHQGRLSAGNLPGGGAVVRLTLPRE